MGKVHNINPDQQERTDSLEKIKTQVLEASGDMQTALLLWSTPDGKMHLSTGGECGVPELITMCELAKQIFLEAYGDE